MVAVHIPYIYDNGKGCSLAKISMVAEQYCLQFLCFCSCSLAKISMVAELVNKYLVG